MCRGGGRGEEELSSPSDPGSGCSGVPQGWTAHLPALLPPLRLNCPPTHTHPCTHKGLDLGMGLGQRSSPSSAEKGCLEKPGVCFDSVPSFSFAPGKVLTPKLGTFLEAWLAVDMLPWALVCRGRRSLGT